METILDSVDYCSCTCDFWSKGNRKFLAVNVHYIVESNDKSEHLVETKLLACKRLRGVINNIVIAEELLKILVRYKIAEKVTAVTTDNGADFVAAMRNHGDNYSSYEEYLEERDEDDALLWYDNTEETQEGDDDYDDNDFDVVEMVPSSEFIQAGSANVLPLTLADVGNDSITTANSEAIRLHDVQDIENVVASELELHLGEESKNFLPIRIACAPHTLNLVGKTDSYNALLDEEYASVYMGVMAKLNCLWTTSTRSRKNSEVVEKYLKREIKKPHRIRWNRIYDAVIMNCPVFI